MVLAIVFQSEHSVVYSHKDTEYWRHPIEITRNHLPVLIIELAAMGTDILSLQERQVHVMSWPVLTACLYEALSNPA